VGLRITKFLAGVLFILVGLWMSAGHFLSAEAREPVQVAAGLLVLLTGIYFLLRKVEAFDLFRIGVGAVLGSVAVHLAGGGVLGILALKAGAGAVVDAESGGAVGSVIMIASALLVLGIYYYALWADSNVKRILGNIFAVPELLGKIVFTLTLLAIYRIGFHVPLLAVNQDALRQLAGRVRCLAWVSCRTFPLRLSSRCWAMLSQPWRNCRRKARQVARKSRNIPAMQPSPCASSRLFSGCDT